MRLGKSGSLGRYHFNCGAWEAWNIASQSIMHLSALSLCLCNKLRYRCDIMLLREAVSANSLNRQPKGFLKQGMHWPLYLKGEKLSIGR